MTAALARRLWLALGVLALACGILGIVLPLLPTTPFAILAAYAFARSSPRLHARLLADRRLGPLIRAWQEHRAIPRRAKLAALAAMAATVAVSLAVGISGAVLVVQVAILAAVAAFLVSRPEPPAR